MKYRRFAPPIALMPLWLGLWLGLSTLAVPANAQAQARHFLDPTRIDRAVASFTGAAIGQPGGARSATDRRLRLADCAGALETQFFGRAQRTVSVACPGPGGWRIFVALMPSQRSARRSIVVARGDVITVAIEGRGFTVQQTGEAIERGAIGDWIKIRTAPRAKPISARIERPGRAVIPAS